MVYNRNEVVERALSVNGGPNTPGMCQAWTRGIIGAHAVGDVDGDGDADAVDGWASEPMAHRRYDRNPPAGVPVAWGGGSRGFGHRAISVGNGRIISTDAGGRGKIAIMPLSWFETNWGMKYLGWSTTMSGIVIPTVKQNKSYFDAISWNVNRKSAAGAVRAALVEMIDKRSPDVIYLYEGAHLHGELNDLGYKVHHIRDRVKGNVIALVRNNLTVNKSFVTRMREFWTGPILGRPQKPRIYRSLKISKRKVSWKVVGVHFPFGTEPRRESVKWVRKILVARIKWPIIVFGDYNFHKSYVIDNIAAPSKAKVAGAVIDLAVYKNCEVVRDENLGDFDLSDHPARYYRFVK